jgi:hypothetical protein
VWVSFPNVSETFFGFHHQGVSRNPKSEDNIPSPEDDVPEDITESSTHQILHTFLYNVGYLTSIDPFKLLH